MVKLSQKAMKRCDEIPDNITFERYARFIKEDAKNRAKFVDNWYIFGTNENPTRLKARSKGGL